MSEHLERLEALLAKHQELHAALLAAAEEKRQAIIRGDLDAMQHVLQTEEQLLAEVKETEREREVAAREASVALGLADESLKLEALIARAPAAAGRRLKQSQKDLRATLDALRRRTRQNRELLHASIEHVQAFLRLVMESLRPSPKLYGRDGKRHGGAVGLLDRRA